MKRLVAGLSVAASMALSITACSPDGPGSTATSEPTATVDRQSSVEAQNGASVSPVSTGTAKTPATAGHGKCLDPASPLVTAAVGNVDSYYGRVFQVYRSSDERLGSCPNLMWVEAHIRGATGSSPEQVLFFDADGFVRTDTDRNTAFTRVSAWSGDSVSVTYRWLNDGDVTAKPTGGPVVVTYTLSNGKVTADRAVPVQAYGDRSGPATATSSTPAPSASHCDTATASTLHDAADMQYHGSLVQPFSMVNIICDGQWAIARTQSSAAQPVRVLFRYTGGGWSAIAMGTGFSCTDNGVPTATAATLGCG
ncbi:LppP/LprE family lipoprotein [Gordonia sp. TBRC 11910]|uniref:LppP/LprE family lipoprotein n=1 Tax=Gordonia asplenii TaxID=2725283 RepID=A0A848KWC7_9ACTN|nr:LppP/LprE family lipoprotein [Gordonia asplenii]NMO01175.1 LppP/LprE family lipoprotein [Gordonia asplenii]